MRSDFLRSPASLGLDLNCEWPECLRMGCDQVYWNEANQKWQCLSIDKLLPASKAVYPTLPLIN